MEHITKFHDNLKIKMDNCSMFHVPCSMKQKGVTLIELIVVLAVFMIIIGVAINIFISIVQHQKRILAEQELLNQMSYFAEYISRNLRMAIKDTTGACLSDGGIQYPGYVYLLTNYDSNSGFYKGVKFIASNNDCEGFFLDTDGVLKEIKNGGQAQAILSSKFTINYVRFIVNGDKTLQGASEADQIQPRITILLDIRTQTNDIQQERVFQTTISQRNLNTP